MNFFFIELQRVSNVELEKADCIIIFFMLLSHRQRDEMRKKKHSENNNTYTNGSSIDSNHHNERLSSTTSDTLSVTSSVTTNGNNRVELSGFQQRSSQDSTDQYVLVETLHDDSVKHFYNKFCHNYLKYHVFTI